MKNILFKRAPVGELVDADDKAGIIKGYASVFDNIDSDNDIIRKGSYLKTVSENGNRVKYLYQHEMDKPIGKILNLEEDQKGLVFEAQIAKTTLGKDVMELIKTGIITENSVGIMPIRKEINAEGQREIFECKLYEISCVTLAANDEAKIIDFKGNKKESILKRYDNLAKLLRKGNISDDLGFAIESEIFKLKKLYSDLITLPKEIEITEPIVVKENEDDYYKTIFNYLNSKR
tara:strand:- start:5779 stop:6477 length:699 start_codon:yes stop_codon:yes gene_type:complete